MKTPTISIYVNLLLFLGWSCANEMVQDSELHLDEIVYGTWEIRQQKSTLLFQNEAWNDLNPPYSIYSFFSERDSFSLVLSNGSVLSAGQFEVSVTDSLITFFPRFGMQTYEVTYFDENQIDLFIDTDEGPEGRRLVRR